MNSDSVRLECGHRFHTKVLIIMKYLVHNILLARVLLKMPIFFAEANLIPTKWLSW